MYPSIFILNALCNYANFFLGAFPREIDLQCRGEETGCLLQWPSMNGSYNYWKRDFFGPFSGFFSWIPFTSLQFISKYKKRILPLLLRSHFDIFSTSAACAAKGDPHIHPQRPLRNPPPPFDFLSLPFQMWSATIYNTFLLRLFMRTIKWNKSQKDNL